MQQGNFTSLQESKDQLMNLIIAIRVKDVRMERNNRRKQRYETDKHPLYMLSTIQNQKLAYQKTTGMSNFFLTFENR